MADKILTEDDVRQIARGEANYAIGKHREQYHEANGLVAAMNAREDAGRFGDPEQLQVQLAGCSVAALGGTQDPAVRGKYGWSPPYQDVLDLRLKYEALLESSKRAAVEALRAAANDDLLTADQLRMSDRSDDAAEFTKSAGRLRRRADRIERRVKP